MKFYFFILNHRYIPHLGVFLGVEPYNKLFCLCTAVGGLQIVVLFSTFSILFLIPMFDIPGDDSGPIIDRLALVKLESG